ncbi:2-C-methyl-D-erythritol 4-phosphate cytidylyltransferase [Brachybacterium huguangmaarense]
MAASPRPAPGVTPSDIRPLVLALAQSTSVAPAEAPGLRRLGGATLLARLLATLADVCPVPPLVLADPGHLGDIEAVVGRAGSVVPAATGAPPRIAALAGALAHLGDDAPGTLLIHDAARALTPSSVIAAALEALAPDIDAVVPGLSVTDSVKRESARGLLNVERSGLVSLQSPRLVRRETLELALGPDADGVHRGDDEIRRAAARGARVRVIPGSHRGEAVSGPLSLWQAQIGLGLARDTGGRQSRHRRGRSA